MKADFREEFCMKNVREGVVMHFISHVLDTCKVSNVLICSCVSCFVNLKMNRMCISTESSRNWFPWCIGFHRVWWRPRLLLPANTDPGAVSSGSRYGALHHHLPRYVRGRALPPHGGGTCHCHAHSRLVG